MKKLDEEVKLQLAMEDERLNCNKQGNITTTPYRPSQSPTVIDTRLNNELPEARKSNTFCNILYNGLNEE